jgi:hypothetical protein
MAVQYASLVFSGRFARESGRNIFALLAPGFAVMSLPALALLPFFAGPGMPPLRDCAGLALLCSLFCIAGNAAVLCMLKTVEASRVSPLLAAKVPVLAVFYCVACGHRYTGPQWLGVALVAPAAWLLCKAGRAIPAKALCWLAASIAFFGASDHCIGLLLTAFEQCGPKWRASMLAFLAMHAAGGVFGVAGMAFGLRPERRHFMRSILPYSFFWFSYLSLLLPCFALLGIVGGNIVQSARGLVAVALGWCVARIGFGNLEERVTSAVFFRRVAACVLILVAALLFNLKWGRGL